MSRSYGSVLPNSLTYIVPSTRGCSPWRPAADIGTDRRENHASPQDFQGPARTGQDSAHARCFTGSSRDTISLSLGYPIPGSCRPLQRKENSPQRPRRRLLDRLRYRIWCCPAIARRNASTRAARLSTNLRVQVREYSPDSLSIWCRGRVVCARRQGALVRAESQAPTPSLRNGVALSLRTD